MISIKKVKEIREQLNLSHVVIFCITDDGKQHVATHGKTKVNAKEAAQAGNNLKTSLDWPKEMCNSKPMERICLNCAFWERGYHRPGNVIEENQKGLCCYNPEKVKRYEYDIACSNLEPSC